MQRWPRGALPKPAKKWQVESRHKHRQSPTKREREKDSERASEREWGERHLSDCGSSSLAGVIRLQMLSKRARIHNARRGEEQPRQLQPGSQAGTLAAPRATTFRFTCSGVIKLQFLYNIYTQWVVVAVRGYPHRGGGRQGASVECGKSSCPWHIMTFRHSCKCRQQASPWRLPYNTDITICGLLGIMHVCWSPPSLAHSPLVCVGVYVWVCMLLC